MRLDNQGRNYDVPQGPIPIVSCLVAIVAAVLAAVYLLAVALA